MFIFSKQLRFALFLPLFLCIFDNLNTPFETALFKNPIKCYSIQFLHTETAIHSPICKSFNLNAMIQLRAFHSLPKVIQ